MLCFHKKSNRKQNTKPNKTKHSKPKQTEPPLSRRRQKDAEGTTGPVRRCVWGEGLSDGAAKEKKVQQFFRARQNTKVVFCRVRTEPCPGHFPGCYPYRNSCTVLYDIHICSRNFFKFCTPVPQYPGYAYNIRIPTRNFREFLWDFHTCIRNFWNFWKTFKTSIPYPELRSARLAYPYPELLWALSDRHNTRGTGIPLSQYPGYRYRFGVYLRVPGMQRILTSCLVSHTSNTKMKIYLTSFVFYAKLLFLLQLYCILVFACLHSEVLLAGLDNM